MVPRSRRPKGGSHGAGTASGPVLGAVPRPRSRPGHHGLSSLHRHPDRHRARRRLGSSVDLPVRPRPGRGGGHQRRRGGPPGLRAPADDPVPAEVPALVVRLEPQPPPILEQSRCVLGVDGRPLSFHRRGAVRPSGLPLSGRPARPQPVASPGEVVPGDPALLCAGGPVDRGGGVGGGARGAALPLPPPPPPPPAVPATAVAGTTPRAARMPARQPSARPPVGGLSVSTGIPLRARSQATTELEFHISPAPSSSRPQTSGGTEPVRSSTRRAASRSSVTRRGPPTASDTSGMTPSRQRRISYRRKRNRARLGLPTGPSATTPRVRPSAFGIGQAFSITNRPSGTWTSSAAWYRSRGRRRPTKAWNASYRRPLSRTNQPPAPSGIQNRSTPTPRWRSAIIPIPPPPR